MADKPIKHVVMFSGGIGSWATAKVVASQYGAENTILLFADVGGGGVEATYARMNGEIPEGRSEHIGEDLDCYRFIKDAAENIGAELAIVNEGKDIWETFIKDKFLGNSRLANCSKFLKQIPCRKWLDERFKDDPDGCRVYVGIDWTETHRIPAITKAYLPYKAFAPLSEPVNTPLDDAPVFLDKERMIEWAESEGLQAPALYRQGYPHNNCGGGCVRAGQGQFKLLLRQNPERFAVWEAKEKEVQEAIGTDSTILTYVERGEKKPLPLTVLRQREESSPSLFDDLDFGGCGCFVQEI